MKRLCVIWIIAIAGLAAGCGNKQPQGPNFAAMDWRKIDVRYSVPRPGEAIHLRGHRKFVVEDLNTVLKLRQLLTVVKIGKNPSPGNEIAITMGDGTVWQGDCFDGELHLRETSGDCRSYYITLADGKFYALLRQLCLQNELSKNPAAQLRDIDL